MSIGAHLLPIKYTHIFKFIDPILAITKDDHIDDTQIAA